MRGIGRGNMFGASIAELRCVDTGKEVFPGAEKSRRDGKVHLVDESRAKVLPNGGDATAEPDISSVGGFRGALQRVVNAVRDEVKRGAAVHRDRGARVVGQHEDGGV